MVSGAPGGRHRAPDCPDPDRPRPTPSWLEDLCARCAGDGWLPDPDWQAWSEQRAWLAEAAAAAAGEIESALVLDQLSKHDADRPAGPRHHRCGDCAGVGTVPTEDGARLLEFLDRHADGS